MSWNLNNSYILERRMTYVSGFADTYCVLLIFDENLQIKLVLIKNIICKSSLLKQLNQIWLSLAGNFHGNHLSKLCLTAPPLTKMAAIVKNDFFPRLILLPFMQSKWSNLQCSYLTMSCSMCLLGFSVEPFNRFILIMQIRLILIKKITPKYSI